MKRDEVIQDNTRALGELADAIRPIDYAGHTPVGEDDNTTDVCAECRREARLAGHSADYQLGYQQAVIDMIGKIAEQHQARLDEILARLERGPAE